jgi:signal peptidase I
MARETLALSDLPELRDLLLASGKVRLRIASRSMLPTLRPGDEIAVEPVPIEALQPGDLILFQGGRELVCHRLVAVFEGALLTRGDAGSSAGERIAPHHVLGKVVKIRKRTLWLGFKVALQSALLPPLLRWLRRLQRLKAYRILLRPLVAPALSYHVGLARGAVRYDWLELPKDNRFPALPRSARPHLLVARRGEKDAGWSVLVFRDSAWRCETLYVRLRYRGLGLESDLGRLTRLLLRAQ